MKAKYSIGTMVKVIIAEGGAAETKFGEITGYLLTKNSFQYQVDVLGMIPEGDIVSAYRPILTRKRKKKAVQAELAV